MNNWHMVQMTTPNLKRSWYVRIKISAFKRISDGSTLVYQILTVATTTTIKAFTPNIYSQPHKSLFSIQLYYLRAHQLREKHDWDTMILNVKYSYHYIKLRFTKTWCKHLFLRNETVNVSYDLKLTQRFVILSYWDYHLYFNNHQ